MLNGNFVLVALLDNEYEGKIYHKATVEMDNRIVTVGCDNDAYAVLKGNKYKLFSGTFDIGQSKSGLYCRLKDAQLASSK